ncbi:FtsX-like permease family protein [Desulfosporosinus nitroreducens]|uniref:FtsX-like permease family protein n=1 Tax=Desulfosporosinus nitroreducens TaxID=2018668 RepID=UPI00207C2335|nr:FtsX-like permease family protein [Desulfosporosinus nitroreducens]MCO1604123.1 FtsX-like permease family protein [Desulfosporosinus nitroreducens]
MIKVRNKKAIRNLADKSFRANKIRNIFAVIAIALTALLFTSIFTMGFGAVESMQRASMAMSGGDGHAVIKYVTDQEYEGVSKHPLIKEMAYCRILGDSVDNENLIKRRTEFWYYDDTGLKFGFAEPTGGHKPQAENEVLADTKTLELMGVPLEVGAPLSLELSVHGKQVKRDFVLAGWWESDPGFNIGQIFSSRAYVDAHLDELQNTYYQDSSLTGAVNGYIKFENSLNIERDLERVLTESGFSIEEGSPNYMATGVNWAYMSTGVALDAGTIIGLASALLLFVFTGYLIIYNIFQISVLRDIRFYGLLKTVGTTGRQLRTIIRRQALMLSLIGIPLGLLGGFFVGKALVPTLMAQSTYAGSAVSVSPNPLIFAGAAVFALLTVLISTYKPGKMAAKVSPVEAVGYTDNVQGNRKKLKKSKNGAKPKRMALANLGRNKKRTLLVILSLGLSIVLTNTVFTLSQSVDVNKALENFCDSDFLIGHADLFNNQYDGEESALSERFIAAVSGQKDFETGGRLYGSWGSYQSETSAQTMNRQPDGSFSTALYGLDKFPFSRLRLVDGELDADKLATGNYILEGVATDDHGNVEMNSANHKVGDVLRLTCGDKVREMTVLGHVIENPNTNTDGSWLGSIFFLPSEVYKELTGKTYVMSYAFNISDDQEAGMETFLKQYTDSVEPTMNYKSKFTALAGLKGIQNTAVLIGGALALIIGLIGVLNFINAILTSILTRRKEFAMLQSIGMTRKQLVKMLCFEGRYYATLTATSSVVLSIACSLLIVRPLCGQIWFTSYHFVFWPLLIVLPLLFVLGIFVPLIAYHTTDKQSIVERLRETES